MTQLFFLLENNLAPLQSILRAEGCSVLLPYEPGINLPPNAPDEAIIAKVITQKEDLGIGRIIITRDKRFITHIGISPVKFIVLSDKKNVFVMRQMNLKQLALVIIGKAMSLLNQTAPVIEYVECAKFYR